MDKREQYDLNQNLLDATSYGCLKTVIFNLEKGASIYVTDYNKRTIAERAAHFGHLHILKYLMNEFPYFHNDKDLYLKNAAAANKLDIVKYCVLEQNCDINYAIEYAEYYDRYDIIDWGKQYIASKELNNKLQIDLIDNNESCLIKKNKL